MQGEQIDVAIQHHLEWIENFRKALRGDRSRDFDLPKAKDDANCTLGKWLATPEALSLLGEDLHSRTMALHGAFHEIAGEVIVSLAQRDPIDVTEPLIGALNDLSKGLMEFLEFAKRTIGRINAKRHDE